MSLSDDQLRDRLCNYDPRNPLYADLALSDDDLPPAAAEGCGCDNCFYGRHALADELLALRARLGGTPNAIEVLEEAAVQYGRNHDSAPFCERAFYQRDLDAARAAITTLVQVSP